MDEGRLYRKRSAAHAPGILAAAGLIAIEHMPARLAEDHANARFLAEGLAVLPGVRVLNPEPATNIVVFEAPSPPA